MLKKNNCLAFCRLFSALVIAAGCNKVEKPALYFPPATDTIVYTESIADFPNPDRGFYRYTETYANAWEPLQLNQLKEWRNLNEADDGNYSIYSTLVYRGVVLKGFANQPLTEELLANISNDFNTAREAGLKLILRFAYNIDPQSGGCPEGFICPPYKDAPKNIVLGHIAQLKPLLQQHADVLCCLQMGFIGMWGENYYSDYFGDPSSNGIGKFKDKNWNDKSEVIDALLDAVPATRMIQVRTPQLKQKYIYGADAPVNADALTETNAYTGTATSRIGFHNDCFLSSVNDYGTYDDYGSTASPRVSGNLLKPYVMDDGRYVAVGGETCDDTYSPENDCENAGKAQTEMRNLHYSFLNCAYNNDVNNDWQTGGCMDDIKRNLGYRFVLRKALVPKSAAHAGKLFSFNLEMENVGYAAPFNSYPAKIILRNSNGLQETAISIPLDVRRWYSGAHAQKITILLPASLTAGTYNLLFSLPDVYESLSGRPEYAIRFANENCWEATTGYNNLGFSIRVE